MQPGIAILIGLVIGVALAALVTIMLRARAIHAARARFGPEYRRLVDEAGSRHRAAHVLHKREKRVERLKLHEIGGALREAFCGRTNA